MPPSRAPREWRPDTALQVAWLLLFLADDESYGRALFARLHERGVGIESNHAYRILRTLDRDEAIRSRWTASDAGPPRRSYRLTRKGRSRLAELAGSITAALQVQERFLREYESANRTPAPGGAEGLTGVALAPSQSDPALAVGRELLTAWLLLLLQLEPRPSYGYGLRGALDAHRVRADPGAIYRVLRTLEREGWLESSWMRSAAGPRRRLYRLTGAGRRHLEELASAVTASRDSHAAFLDAYRHAAGPPGPERPDDA